MHTEASLWPLSQELNKARFVDMTHPFNFVSLQMSVEWGTTVVAPILFVKEGRALDQFSPKEMILPLVVIDISQKVAENPDYILLVDDVISWEDRNGRVPKGAFVALRSDWSKRWPDIASIQNFDNNQVPHYPGWGLDALSYLYEDCEITASGQETPSADAGFRSKETNRMCDRYLAKKDRFQIHLLAGLDQCPTKGALVFCTFSKPKNGSSFPARIFAMCPQNNDTR